MALNLHSPLMVLFLLRLAQDSGATSHFCRDRSAFETNRSIAPIKIRGFDGLMYGIGEGVISLDCVGRNAPF